MSSSDTNIDTFEDDFYNQVLSNNCDDNSCSQHSIDVPDEPRFSQKTKIGGNDAPRSGLFYILVVFCILLLFYLFTDITQSLCDRKCSSH
jgi:hypothetical protein